MSSSAEDEAQVLEVVHEAVVERGFVDDRHVPADEHDDPDGVADSGAEQEREPAPQRPHPGERGEQVAREEEDRQRPAHGEQDQHDPEVGDQNVLQHVDPLQVVLADVVDGRDDREHRDGHTRDEEGDPWSRARARRDGV